MTSSTAPDPSYQRDTFNQSSTSIEWNPANVDGSVSELEPYLQSIALENDIDIVERAIQMLEKYRHSQTGLFLLLFSYS